jgi:hypothetical protein
MCRKSASELAQLGPILSKVDVRLVAIGTGSTHSIQPFQEDTGFSSDIWIDPTAKLYRFLSCKRGMKNGLLNAKTLQAVKVAWKQGYVMKGLDGHVFQLGGVFVIYNGEVIWQHHDEYAGHTPDYPNLLASCGVPREIIGDLTLVAPIDRDPTMTPTAVADLAVPTNALKRDNSNVGMLARRRSGSGSGFNS